MINECVQRTGTGTKIPTRARGRSGRPRAFEQRCMEIGNPDLATFQFPKQVRLLKSAQFNRVFQRRCSRADDTLIVYACENDEGRPRLGLVVSRKYGSSVARSRWKRCLREAFRLAQHELPQALDLVVLPRSRAVPTMARMQASLTRLAQQLEQRLSRGESPR